MQGALFQKFKHNEELLEELQSKSKRNSLFLLLSIFVLIFILIYFFDNYQTVDGGEHLMWIIVIIFAVSIINDFRILAQISKISTNITKNELELGPTYISGIYTENPKTADNDKYFRVEYNQISKIEIKDVDIKENMYHNFLIYYTSGMVKLSINNPKEAYGVISKAIYNTGENIGNGQIWECPQCKCKVYFGQPSCETCGQKFDWSKQ